MNKPETEETLQSIADTLKRIENILIDQIRPTEVSINIADWKKGEKRWEQRKTE